MVDTTNINGKEANLRTKGSKGHKVADNQAKVDCFTYDDPLSKKETSLQEIIEENLDLPAGTDEQRTQVRRYTIIRRKPRLLYEDISAFLKW
ncbi:hypothetical protein GJ496_010247 [Pomphorhynchus laevis]|nr:hypothetical protein GJ496_010247 [Pomphorhynchus laevis]